MALTSTVIQDAASNAPSPEARAQAPWALVADIGGTNARFASTTLGEMGLGHVTSLPVADHADVASAIRHVLATMASQGLGPGRPWRPPVAVALAVASPIGGDLVSLTNGPWSFSRRALQQALGQPVLLVLNDFEALALSLPRLGAHQLRFWGAPASATQASSPRPALGEASQARGLAVVGPGTGLGVAAAVRHGRHWHALPSEGGHATLAPADAFESDVLRAARGVHAHVSAERLLSGTGLPLLHRAMAEVRGVVAQPMSAETIVALGVAQQDDACAATLECFCAMLGSFCGNVALTLGTRDGLYVGGGIVPRLGERFFESAFRERFEAKGRYQSYLRGIPTALITDTMAALSGAAAAVEPLMLAEA